MANDSRSSRGKLYSLPSPEEQERWAEEQAVEDELEKRAEIVLSGSTEVATLEPLEESPALNRILLRNARKSLRDISAATGIPTDEVAERLAYLLDDSNWRDDLMEEKLLLKEVAMLVDDIRERMNRFSIEDEAWASMARVQLQAIKTLLEQLDKRRKAVDGKLSLVNDMTAKLITDAILINNKLTAEALARKFGITEDEVYAEWEEQWPNAVALVEASKDRPVNG